MRTLRFDSVGGASGDMILASLVSLGIAPASLHSELATLRVDPFELLASPAVDQGIAGVRLDVRFPHPEHHPHRGLHDIQALIEPSALPAPVRRLSLRVFERLAEVEARIHGTTPDRVHFHEVGAMDSIVDIVGSCLALHRLGVDRVVLGPLPQGTGTIRCAHGVMPNPPPATAELLKGLAVQPTDEPFELVTPTGAALLSVWASSDLRTGDALAAIPPPPSAGTASAIGYGLGHRTLQGRPNLLRATVVEVEAAPTLAADRCLVLECNLDDMIPELIGSLSVTLLEAGALDVFAVPVFMKKQRPGTLLTVLCRHERREAILDLLFTGSTTLGVREHEVSRTVLARRQIEVPTPYGPIRVKIGAWKGRDVTRAPEHDDCARAAREHGVAVRAVYEATARALPPAS